MMMVLPKPSDEDLAEFSEADIAALNLAIERFVTREGRAVQVAGKIEQGDSWDEIAGLACFSEQMDVAGASPPRWQIGLTESDDHDADDVRAFKILQ